MPHTYMKLMNEVLQLQAQRRTAEDKLAERDAEITSLREDGERLDWLESLNADRIEIDERFIEGVSEECSTLVLLEWGRDTEASALRQAIDTARGEGES